ncbi:MFS transporter [Vibrio astriarenae]|uniref:MFS transporter n=1 Tax=Vibrio astriarenae TaxID=1481923 RepID=A0A7Z2T1V0_9VIBR|nr:MFS transporter [Vibrio astriarenae]QIA62707.1 MFS transporter [Vibrio astriarenae]
MIEYKSKAYYRVTLSLALGAFLIFCNLYLFQPMLPELAEQFSASAFQINWVFAITSLLLSVSLIPWAVYSERNGRRRVMLMSLFSLPLVAVVMMLSSSLVLLVVARALLGICLAGYLAVGVAYLVEELSERAFTHAIAIYVAANSIGGIGGRLFGGMLLEWGTWQIAVGAMGLLTLSGALLVTVLLPQQRHFKPKTGLLKHHNRAVLKHFSQRPLWTAMLIGGINFALFVNLYTVMGFRLVAAPHNLPVGIASMIFLCYLAGTFSSSLSSKWMRLGSTSAGIGIGTTIMLVGIVVAYFDHLAAMVLGLLLISFGAFFSHTLAYAWTSQKAKTGKATAVALYLVHYYVGGSLGGFWLIYCWQQGAWLAVMLGSAPLIGMLLILGFSLEKMRPQQIAPSP